MTRHILSATALAVALLTPHHSMSAAKPGSNFVDLGTLGGDFSDAFGINNDPNSVQVVGRSTVQHATRIPGAAGGAHDGPRGTGSERGPRPERFGVVVGGGGGRQLHAVLWRVP